MPPKTHDDFASLRRVADGEDQYIAGSRAQHVRGSNKERIQKTPPWVYNDKAVQQIVQRAFPKMQTDERQRKQATLWTQIIHHWWRAGLSEGQAVYQINYDRMQRNHDRASRGESFEPLITVKQLQDTIRRIREVVKGRTTSGKVRGRAPNKPNGRPRKQPLSDGPDEME